jgi:hypothetical protein
MRAFTFRFLPILLFTLVLGACETPDNSKSLVENSMKRTTWRLDRYTIGSAIQGETTDCRYANRFLFSDTNKVFLNPNGPTTACVFENQQTVFLWTVNTNGTLVTLTYDLRTMQVVDEPLTYNVRLVNNNLLRLQYQEPQALGSTLHLFYFEPSNN